MVDMRSEPLVGLWVESYGNGEKFILDTKLWVRYKWMFEQTDEISEAGNAKNGKFREGISDISWM